jgi:hypothetical protein
MKICIAGASGFIGKNLVNDLRRDKHEISTIGRRDFKENNVGMKLMNSECVINLCGESIAGIWTRRKKKRIFQSRVNTTRILVEQVNQVGLNVRIFISISGVGIYDRIHYHGEKSLFFADNFLAYLIKDWEGSLNGIVDKKIKIVVLRLGVVLGKNGGIMKKIRIPFRLGFGFVIKSNENFSFIHIQDLISVFRLAILDDSLSGIVNVLSKENISIQDFFYALGDAIKCKVRIPVRPSFLKVIMGESSVILTEGQNVIPEVLIKREFEFLFQGIREVFKNILIDQ